MDGAVFFDARGLGLANHFDIHVGGSGSLKFSVTGYKGNLQNDRIAGSDRDDFARYFREFQTACCEPGQLALVASGLEVSEDGSDGHLLLNGADVRPAWQGIGAGTLG